MTSLQPRDRSAQARAQTRGSDGRFARCDNAPSCMRPQAPTPSPEAPRPIGVMRVILKGNRDVLGQVEKQSAMDAILAFLEVTAGAEVKRGQNCWLVAMPPIIGDTPRLMQGVLREGNIVGVARDPEQAQALGRKLAERYDPDTDGRAGYGVVDTYMEKFYMHGDGWDIYDNSEER